MADIFRMIGIVVAVLIVAPLMGGILGAIADMTASGLIAGTPLGPNHPQTAIWWTVIAVGVLVGVKEVRS